MCVHARRGQRTSSAITPQAWLTLVFEIGSFPDPQSSCSGRLAGQGVPLSLPPSPGITRAYSHTCLFTWIWGLELRSSGLLRNRSLLSKPSPQPTLKISHCVFFVARVIQSSYQHTAFQKDKKIRAYFLYVPIFQKPIL